jgi:hypothetical protein
MYSCGTIYFSSSLDKLLLVDKIAVITFYHTISEVDFYDTRRRQAQALDLHKIKSVTIKLVMQGRYLPPSTPFDAVLSL